MQGEDKTLENLLELDGVRFVVDEALGLWVKFEARRIKQSNDRPHGIRYSLTLHNRFNHRLLGFDNSHAIEYGGKTKVSPKRQYDHWHSDKTDKGQPYDYKNAAKLMEDFWREVHQVVESFKR